MIVTRRRGINFSWVEREGGGPKQGQRERSNRTHVMIRNPGVLAVKIGENISVGQKWAPVR